MNGVDWIRLYTDFFDNPKIRQIKTYKKGDMIICVWINLLCLAGKQNRCGVFMITDLKPYTIEGLANEIGRNIKDFKIAIETLMDFEMLINLDGVIAIKNWGVYQQQIDSLDKQREQTRLRVQKYRERQKNIRNTSNNSNASVTSYNTVTLRNGNANVTQGEYSRVNNYIYKEKEEDKEEKSSSIETLLNLFLNTFNIQLDNYSSAVSEMDFEALTKAFNESTWLKNNITSFKKVCELYPKIISGYYRNYDDGEIIIAQEEWNKFERVFNEMKSNSSRFNISYDDYDEYKLGQEKLYNTLSEDVRAYYGDYSGVIGLFEYKSLENEKARFIRDFEKFCIKRRKKGLK